LTRRNRTHFKRGRDLFNTRIGQINLACTHCHDRNFGRKLLNDTISQGTATVSRRIVSSGKRWVRCIAGCARVFFGVRANYRGWVTGSARSRTLSRVAGTGLASRITRSAALG
jgi:hypothetical protein